MKEFYDWGKQIGSHGLPESEHGPKLQPFTVIYNNDLKATWYLSLKGGGCKNKTHFCHLCACAKNSITHYQIGDDWCSRCKRKGRQRCYHHEVCDVVRVDSLRNDLEVQLGSYYERHGKRYHYIQQWSKLLTDHMQANKDTDRNHIDYVIPADSERQKEYANFIARECILRGIRIDVSNNVEDMQSALRLAVAMEKYIKFLKNVRQWSDSGREFVPLVELVELLIPCILPLENRVGEKIISTIIKKGIDVYDLGRKEGFIEQLSKTFQTQVFGTVESPSQWKLRYSKDGGHLTLDAIRLCNNAT